MDMQSLASPDSNVTKTDITKNNKPNPNKSKPMDMKGNLKKTLQEADWQAAVGPYPVVSPGKD